MTTIVTMIVTCNHCENAASPANAESSPDGATAAYRVGDSATNIITPIMVYFPLVLVFAQRWQKDFGLGSLTAMMIPYSIWMLISGTVLMMIWLFLGLPLGPGAPANIAMPG